MSKVKTLSFKAWVCVFVFCGLFSFQGAQAALFSLPELEQGMMDPIFRTLGSSFAFRPIEPASDLGLLGGFYLGTSASLIDASAVSSVFTSGSSSFVPLGDLQLGFGIPTIGVTIEAGILPSFSISGTKLNKYAGAVKWTLTRTILKVSPIDMALRLAYGTGSLNFNQNLSAGTVDVDYSARSFGTNFVVSKSLFIFEPYVGIGWVTSSSKLIASGTANLFGSSFPVGTNEYQQSYSSLWTQFGMMMKLGFFGLSFEYDNMLSTSSWNGKVSFRF